MRATWEQHEKHGRLTKQSDLPDTVFAFPGAHKEPMTDAQHVRKAVARSDQVDGVSDVERALAFENIEKGAQYRVDQPLLVFIPTDPGMRRYVRQYGRAVI